MWTTRRCPCLSGVTHPRGQRDYGLTSARASESRTASGLTTSQRSCSSSRSRVQEHIRCCTLTNTKGTCRPTRIAVMARFTSQAISSKSDAGLIAVDGSSKLLRIRRSRGSQRKPFSGSPSYMRLNHGSKTRHQTSSSRHGKPKPCRCLHSFFSGSRRTALVCSHERRLPRHLVMRYGTGRR